MVQKQGKISNVINQKKPPQKVLIIEDDEFMSKLLAMRLKKDGIAFDLVMDVKNGLDKIKKAKPSLILLDLVLPGIDGYEFLERIKADKETALIPVIIISNLGQQSEIERGMRLGARDYIVKTDFDLGDISNKIMQVLKSES